MKLITFTNTKCDNVEIYNETNIVNVIKCSSLRGAGHVVRMDESELSKKYCEQNLEVKKNVPTEIKMD